MTRGLGSTACFCVTCFCGASVPAFAQTLAAAAGVESVVVTARLRAEDPQTIPVSMSVVDSGDLTVTRTDNIQQLQFLAPSLNYASPNPRNTSYTMRGLGSSVAAIAQSMLPNLIFGLAALLSALAIWFLVRNRAAFGRAESA